MSLVAEPVRGVGLADLLRDTRHLAAHGLTLAELAPMIREALKDKRYRASSQGALVGRYIRWFRNEKGALLDMYERHAGWCGYNKDAPGDHIHRTATENARDLLADQDGAA